MPVVAIASIGIGPLHICAVAAGDHLTCWGHEEPDDEGWQVDVPPITRYVVPAGSFKSVSAGYRFTCAIRTDDSLACWGRDTWGQTSPPAGSFASVSAGYEHACAIRFDDSLVCWGWDGRGQASPPAGSFASVSSSAFHTCAVRTDGSARAGQRRLRADRRPAGTFSVGQQRLHLHLRAQGRRLAGVLGAQRLRTGQPAG